ncbi:DUF2760 domain-containing protein, partial [Burkholderia sp. Ac-20349]|uniref:DUF2760 domain-containing protein n=1 Tax=Burkholderia sp. Ac-20349 TaxID=2703893 RepID=UPI001F119505
CSRITRRFEPGRSAVGPSAECGTGRKLTTISATRSARRLPVRDEAEGSRVTLPAGFDATAVRVTGNVVGSAPFTGTVSHRGWRVADVRLPKLTGSHDASVVAPAEVEL